MAIKKEVDLEALTAVAVAVDKMTLEDESTTEEFAGKDGQGEGVFISHSLIKHEIKVTLTTIIF